MLRYFTKVVGVINSYRDSMKFTYEESERIKDDLLSEYGDDIQETRYGFVNNTLSNESLTEIYELEDRIHDCVMQRVSLRMLGKLTGNKQLKKSVERQIEHAYIDLEAYISHENIECVGSKTTEFDKEIEKLSRQKKYFLKYRHVDDIIRLAGHELTCLGVI